MGVVIGIDVGGSTTKIVGFDAQMHLIEPLFVRATDPVTSVYGAFGKFTQKNALELSDIERVMITGVGSTFITDQIFNLPCTHVEEFKSVGLGGLYLTKLRDAIIVSMGTGTAITHAYFENDRLPKIDYLGGTGVGGGTLVGLSKAILGMDTVEHVAQLAEDGDLSHVDLQIHDLTNGKLSLPSDMTASNFGNLGDTTSKSDLALGIINMVFETVGMMSIFNARSHGARQIVLTGNLTSVPQCKKTFETLNTMFDVQFRIPTLSRFATVIGAALTYRIGQNEPLGTLFDAEEDC